MTNNDGRRVIASKAKRSGLDALRTVVVYDQRVNDIDLGVHGVGGVEYTFAAVPISLFLDGTLFMEVVDDPFLFWPQLGTGARFRF